MPIPLTPQCREALIERLATALADVTVTKGQFINRTSLLAVHESQKVLPAKGPETRQLRALIDDDVMLEFVYGTLSHELQSQPYADTVGTRLADVPGYDDLTAVSARLVKALEALPERYVFSIRLPGGLGRLFSGGIGIDLSPTVHVLHSESPFLESLPRTTGDTDRDRRVHNLGLLGGGPKPWDGTYLVCVTEGFVGAFTDTFPRRFAEDLFKSFCGLALAFSLLKRSRSYTPYARSAGFLIHRQVGDAYELFDESPLPNASAEAYGDMDLNVTAVEGLSDTTFGSAITLLIYMTEAFGPSDTAARIRRAAQWYFDSECADTPLLGFVQAMVCLEILYGDKAAAAKLGLNELLKNRCAYAISSDHAEREAILKSFDEIYDVRSRIVHTGHLRLTGEERGHFLTLKRYCVQALLREIGLLKGKAATGAGPLGTAGQTKPKAPN